MKMYMVGGYVRDEIMGVKSNDIDFSVVLDDWDAASVDPYKVMVGLLEQKGFEIFKDKEGNPISGEFLTARGKFPKNHSIYPNVVADFVLARKEGDYTDGRRPDKVEVGTLDDDLARRDFTMNAIAKYEWVDDDSDGVDYIDPFNGREDIAQGIIRAVGDPFERLTEDALRAVRALRFAVTKNMAIEPQLDFFLQSAAVLDAIVNKISDERISAELSKMFRYDTVDSLTILSLYPSLTEAMFSGRVSLDSTLKTKGRGK